MIGIKKCECHIQNKGLLKNFRKEKKIKSHMNNLVYEMRPFLESKSASLKCQETLLKKIKELDVSLVFFLTFSRPCLPSYILTSIFQYFYCYSCDAVYQDYKMIMLHCMDHEHCFLVQEVLTFKLLSRQISLEINISISTMHTEFLWTGSWLTTNILNLLLGSFQDVKDDDNWHCRQRGVNSLMYGMFESLLNRWALFWIRRDEIIY